MKSEESMKPEDRELLLKDLCGRLPYGVYVQVVDRVGFTHTWELKPEDIQKMWSYKSIKPYLRPMSSMTKEEIIEFNNIPSTKNYTIIENDLPWAVAHYKQIDWLNKKMFDFRGLIPKDLALSTSVFNPYKD